MKKLRPLGENLLVLPLPKETHSTESGIQVTDTIIAKAKVMEVSEELKDVYKKGDIVLYAENAGIFQYYKSQNCLWLNGIGYPKGNVIAVIDEVNE